MDPVAFVSSVALAVIAPLAAMRYVTPALRRSLRGVCDQNPGEDFWIFCMQLLAVLGTLLLVLSFGEFRDGVDMLSVLRRTLWLVAAGVFVSVAVVSNMLWSQARRQLQERQRQQMMAALGRGAAPLPADLAR